MERLDRKFDISALHVTKKTIFTHDESVLFLAKDKLIMPMLWFYFLMCFTLMLVFKVKWPQVKGVKLLIGRVRKWRKANRYLLKYPDINYGNEASKVLKPNE